jgi:transketolase
MRDAFIRQLLELAWTDDRIMVITGDLGYGVLDEFQRRLPQQFINVGVAEQNMTGVAVGLALSGRMVITYSIGNFTTLRCLEQLRNDACYHGANVKAVAVGGGFSYGPLGFSHHATEDLAIMRALPEMTVLSPGDCWETAAATRAMLARPGPAYLRLDKSAAEPTHRPGDAFTLGRARMVQDGDAMTLIATGGILGEVLAAARMLAEEGIDCRVLSMHTLKPFDAVAVERAARETGGIVTVEEHSVLGGLAGAVAETCLESGAVPRVFRRLGLRDRFATEVGSQAYLRARHGLDGSSIAGVVRTLVRGETRMVVGL